MHTLDTGDAELKLSMSPFEYLGIALSILWGSMISGVFGACLLGYVESIDDLVVPMLSAVGTTLAGILFAAFLVVTRLIRKRSEAWTKDRSIRPPFENLGIHLFFFWPVITFVATAAYQCDYEQLAANFLGAAMGSTLGAIVLAANSALRKNRQGPV